jgi:hypothetical protein
MWRYDYYSPRITSAAAQLLGMSGWDYESDSTEETLGLAREFLSAIDASPLSRTVRYSGHVLQERLSVGDEVEYPLMATANKMGAALGYAMTLRSSARPTPHDPEMISGWRALRPQLRDAWGPSNVPHGHVVGNGREETPRVVYRLLSSKSVPVSDWESVTSGRFRVVKRTTRKMKDVWLYDLDIHDYRNATYDVVDIEYVGAL